MGESVKGGRNILRFPLLCGMEPFSFSASCYCEYLVICYLKSLPSPLNILQGKIRCIAHLLAKSISLEMKQLLGCALWLNGCHNDRSDDSMLLAKGHDLPTRRNHHRPIPGAHRRSAVIRQLLNLKMILKQTQSSKNRTTLHQKTTCALQPKFWVHHQGGLALVMIAGDASWAFSCDLLGFKNANITGSLFSNKKTIFCFKND